mgnify:FL=1
MDDTNSHDLETCASPPCATTPRTAPTFTSSDVSVRFSDVSVSSRSPPPFSAPRSFPAPTSCNPTQILATIRSRRIDRHPSDLIGNTPSRDATERLFYMNSSAMSTGAHKHMLETLEKIRVEKSEGMRYADAKAHTPGEINANSSRKFTITPGQDGGVDTQTNPQSPDAKGFIARQRVSISGLRSETSLNGKKGTLVRWLNSKKCWAVDESDTEKLARIKPDNLELVRPGPDEPRYWPVGVHISELVFDIGSDAPVAMLVGREGFQGFGGFWGIKQNANRGLSPTKSFDQTSFSRER